MPSYPRESDEFQGVTVKVNGAPVLSGVELCVVDPGVRPSAWVEPDVLEGRIGLFVTGYPVGVHCVWTRANDVPERPVRMAGTFRMT